MMDRRGFLKQIGIYTAGVVIAPVVIKEALATCPEIVEGSPKTGLFAQIENGNIYWYNKLDYEMMIKWMKEMEHQAMYGESRKHVVFTGSKGYEQFKSMSHE